MRTPEQQVSSKSSRFLFTSIKNKVISKNGVTNLLPLNECKCFAQHLMLFTHVLGAHGSVSQNLRLLRFIQDAGPSENLASAHNGKHFKSYVSTMKRIYTVKSITLLARYSRMPSGSSKLYQAIDYQVL